MRIFPYLLSLLLVSPANSKTSNAQSEIGDFVTIKRVVVRAGAVEAIKYCHNPASTVVDKRAILNLVSELHSTSEKLLLSLYLIEILDIPTSK